MLRFQFCVFLSFVKLEMRIKWSDPKSQTQCTLASFITGDGLLFTLTTFCIKDMLLLLYEDSKLMLCRERTAEPSGSVKCGEFHD